MIPKPPALDATQAEQLPQILLEIPANEAARNDARLWAGPRSHLLGQSPRDLDRRVHSHGFLCAHRGALVRIVCVRAVQSDGAGTFVAILISGACVPISRRQRAAFLAAFRP
jgi:DNA-binding LytR/AlgR family response regulator